MKKAKTLILGILIGVILTLATFAVYYYYKHKYNFEVISVKDAVEALGQNASAKLVAYSPKDVIQITATHFQELGDDAKYERFPINFYHPKLSGDFYFSRLRKKDSLYVETYTTTIHDITSRLYEPIVNLIPINIDSLTKEPIFMRNRYYKVNDEILSENIALEVSKNKYAVITYLSGEQYFGTCTPVYINNKLLMLSFIFNNMNGYIIHKKEAWVGKIGDIDFTSKHFEENTYEYEKEIKALSKLKKQSHRPLFANKDNFMIKNGQLFTTNLPYPLLKTPMDTLYFIGDVYARQLIVGEKNQTKYLFNGLLQNISPNKFRAISNHSDNFTVLSDNQTFTINDRGKLAQRTTVNKEKTAQSTDFYKYAIIENGNTFHILCNRYNNDNITETYKTTAIEKPKSIEEITFINNKKEIVVETDKMEFKQNFLVTRTKGLYGLSEFGNLIVAYDDYENKVEEVVVNIELTELLPHNYTQIFANDMTQFVYFENNGLKAYYPIQKKGKYSALGTFINQSFAKFTLPNGKKGWLQDNGKEYFE